MELLLALLCCGALVVTTAFGLGMTLLLERFLGGWAYVVGAILSVVVFTGLYTVYHIWIRAAPCEPVGSLACGQPFFTAFFVFAGVAFFLLIANALAQTSLYLFLYGRRQTIPAALYENAGEENAGAESRAEPGAPSATVEETEPVPVLPTEEQTFDASQWSGLATDAAEDEPQDDLGK